MSFGEVSGEKCQSAGKRGGMVKMKKETTLARGIIWTIKQALSKSIGSLIPLPGLHVSFRIVVPQSGTEFKTEKQENKSSFY